MSESIQEIPLDIPGDVANNTEIITNDAEPVEDNAGPEAIEEAAPPLPDVVEEKIKPKAKGRPRGSANKGPSKPRAKKAQVKETPVIELEEPAAYEPSTPRNERNLRINTDPSSSDIAAAMLKLLQDQTHSRQSRRQRLHDSWFQ